ncbi:SpvB/TcaC N-terminal domain-containing protein [Chryseobacterium camelliae]|uniref:SpvB/TcaC N-terminal domain-containing protein n=1 Tax=Chryseobacterium camelliae TaxID=1265445 RepID=A0ABY7QR12_9FLAO|nr:RHS repeat-associated core domain-containing protein [Chryseobacterium camelliae]WBV61634.1 SpvB/TcaC N-terminal domain-containing protein [Chryseobacterium camelliae]
MKLFSSFILSLCSVMGFSQTLLYQAESTTRTVQDPQRVVLTQGFHATSSVSNPFIAKIGPGTENPGGGPVDSGAGATNPSGTAAPAGQSFHDTKGNIAVTAAGQLQFTLPIATPLGIRDITPKIDLVYNSGSVNGIAGYGWNISGISNILRIGRTIENDNDVKNIQIDYTDYYSLNGQRLILKSGEYGKDGAEYVTEKYSNIRIKSIGNIPNWKQPEYWEVTFEDGSQAWYGGTGSGWNDATNRLSFNIVKWKDPQGNIVNYSYEQENNISIIKSITWGGNEMLGTSSFNEINFNYIDKSVFEGAYINGAGTLFSQTKTLKDIIVKTDGNQFKKYSIDYTNNGTAYQFIEKITEYNSANEQANPVFFEYPQMNSTLVHGMNTGTETTFDNIRFTGDFNGDAYLDFVMTDGTVKFGAFNDSFNIIQSNKYFSSNAIVVNTILDEDGQVFNGNGIVQYENGKVTGYVFKNNTFVKVFEKEIFDISTCTSQPGGEGCTTTVGILKEGDVNGDGISDVFISLKQRVCQFVQIPGCSDVDPISPASDGENIIKPPLCQQLECNTYELGNFIVDLKNSNNPLSTYTLDAGVYENSYTDQKYMDVDGDGKIDIINVSNTNYTIFEFVKINPNQYLKKIKFSGNLEETKGNEFPVLFGDFNGDGKLDFTVPITEGKIGKDDWRFYIGTGKSFNTFFKPDFLMYKNESTQNNGAWLRFSRTMYSISDLNSDGKSDIVQVHAYSNLISNARAIGVVVNSIMSKGMMYNLWDIDFEQQNIYTFPPPGTYSPGATIDDLSIYQPITNVIRANNNYYNVFLFRKDNVLRIKAPTGVDDLKRIKSINQGGVKTYINYLEMVSDNSNNSFFYKKIRNEYYPYFSLQRADRAYAVSQLLREGNKQDFRYRGMTGHMQGKGMIGFHQSARSSWYADGFENTKVWSGVEIDPLLDGIPVKEWSIRTNTESQIFPADISENNTQLLSFKSTIYQTDKLLNGQIVTTVNDIDKPKVVTATVPKNSLSKDFLTNTFTISSITYGDYYLPSQSISNINNGYAISTSTFDYFNNFSGVGAGYFVGRIKSKNDLVQAYNDIKSAKQEYIYENNLLKTLKTWNRDNTGYLLETYGYDSWGNITQKLIGNSIDPQTQTSQAEYDSKGRFIIKATDNLGLITQIEYNDWGQIKKQTDPLNNTLVNTYDAWGKLLTSKTNLGGTTTYQYERDNSLNITVTQYDPDGDVSKKYTNKLGQDYKVSTKSFNQGQFVSSTTEYDVLGRKNKESEPYFEGQNPTQWNVIAYDDSVFPAKVTATAFNGKQLETSVSGLTTSVKELNGYGRTTSKTADALGNVINSIDKGGTIAFSYNAAGEQIKAQYEGNSVITKYDVWGRKSEFNDPLNGVYKYEYNGLGQPKKIISPKGTKEYIYNTLGQLKNQNEISTTDGGQATDKKITLTYDNKGRIISKTGTSKGKAFSSDILYDPQGRLLSSSENSNDKYYIQKGITYDDKGRVISYEKQLYSLGVMTKVQIENVYSSWNGELYQAKDKNSGKVLWQLTETNTRGQVLTSKLGSATVINIYDPNGFLSSVNHSSQLKPSILQISYSFDAIKNELKSRTTGGDFTIAESFDYDDNNRLVNWTNPVTGVKPLLNRNIYDTKGRILENDQVGKMKYENAAKIYQPTSMILNSEGVQNYTNDLIQSIAYNENNDPVFIDGMKGDVAFQYGLTSMRQRVTYGGNFAAAEEGKFTKFYNEDGSFEVVKDNNTGKEKHVLYIGGTPYESNIIFIKNYDEIVGSYKFLHKDYIGSILAISDEAGNKLEQRHFDAWGNFTHLQIGNGAIITDKNIINNTLLLIERGYTSHEHFGEVGIIHMNGRLYDPLLRRFLNADENIQDIFNTQNYNKYGYVLNNPLMYSDPNGEFVWVVVGAVIGAWVTGAKANGTWNPLKWDYGATWGKIAMGAAIGAFSGGVGAAAGSAALAASGVTGGVLGGVIAGGVGGAVGGALSGGLTAAVFGENILTGTLTGLASGAIGGAVVGGIAGGVSQAISNARVANTNIGAKGNIWTGKTVAEGRNPWAFKNMPKNSPPTPTSTPTPTVSKVIVGEMDGQIQKTVGYNINPQTEEVTPITEWGDYKLTPGQEEVIVYRNFGWNELASIKAQRGFSIHPNQFQGKQFWVGESGMKMWTNSRFAKPFTAKIKIPKSFVTPGNKNYIFMESDMIIDGFPGGTVLPSNLEKFNSAMKIEWIRY